MLCWNPSCWKLLRLHERQEWDIDTHQLKLCSNPSLPFSSSSSCIPAVPGLAGKAHWRSRSSAFRTWIIIWQVCWYFLALGSCCVWVLAVYWPNFPGGIVWEVLAQAVPRGWTLGSVLKVTWKLLRSGKWGVCVPLPLPPSPEMANVPHLSAPAPSCSCKNLIFARRGKQRNINQLYTRNVRTGVGLLVGGERGKGECVWQ